MKRCPTCDRTFEDSFTFCLIDGSVLSAPFDLKATQDLPEPRQTTPPPTEALGLPPTIINPQPRQEESAPTTAAPPPASKSLPHAPSPAQPEKKSGRTHLILIGVGALLAVGLVTLIFSARPAGTNGNTANTDAQLRNVAAGVSSNSNSDDKAATPATPSPSPSATPVINLAGTSWRSATAGIVFVFRDDGTLLETDDGRICHWSQRGDNFSFQCPRNRAYQSDRSSGVIKNNNKIEGTTRYSDGSRDTLRWLRVEQ